jgi:hypothetical protein
MKHIVNGAAIEGLVNINLTEFEPRFPLKMIEIRQSSCKQVIRCYYGVAFSQQRVAEMRTKETGATGDQCALSTHT